MKLIVPDYYGEFKCIASECRHSCCIGWEIDIDEDTLSVYDGVEGAFGEKIAASIERTDEGAHFILDQNERCPFLNEKGLCDLIIEMGEENLCQICADHPRFRNHIADRTEMGLGLCCEAAGKLILSRGKKTEFIVLEDDGEEEEFWETDEEILETRDEILKILQDRSVPADVRIEDMLKFCGTGMPDISCKGICNLLLSLERLDSAWDSCLTLLSDDGPCAELSGKMWETAFEQLAVYFVYRHFAGAAEDADVAGRAGFAALSVRIIRRICERLAGESDAFGIEGLVEVARMYSSEIEYSDENMDALRNLFEA
ncbi:MAG: flagellin lysine-N-methylase [Clostridia bacterium]|nr:flagellin lysine-N-methylase [Clostridia bacterium]